MEKKEQIKEEIRLLLGNYDRGDEIFRWLEEIGFFEAPASTKYHGAYPGGLAEHSLKVVTNLLELTDKMHLKWERENGSSPIFIGILHDVCKADLYKPTENGYEYNNDSIFSYHAEKSIAMILGSGCIKMNEEEVACIRWHMGAYEKDTNEWKYLNNAIHKYPNVFWTHVADMMASHLQGV